MSDSEINDVVFREEQRFRQPLLIALVIVASAVMVGVFAWAMIQQLVLHVPFGDKPMPDTALVIMGPLMMFLGAAIGVLFVRATLITEVRGDGVYVRFIPFHRRFHWFQFADIVAAESVTYRPIMEYGGWGIRYGRNGKAFNVSGNRGVRIVFGNGTTLLIGSRQPDELAAAIVRGLSRRP